MDTEQESEIHVKLLADWGSAPLWAARPGEVRLPFSPTELAQEFGLAVPATLVAEIQAWDEEFQQLYRPEDPLNSRFADKDDEDRWLTAGRSIADGLRTVLGDRGTVEYRDAW